MWMRSGNRVLNKIDLVNSRDMANQLMEFREIIRSKQVAEQRKTDKQTRKLLLYLFTSTRGGFTRLRIIVNLLEQPCNTHQLTKELGLDYKAVQHHMKVLEKNNMVSKIGEKYGAIFHLSTFLEMNLGALDEAIDKLDRQMNYIKVYL
jgi:DNA-binding transcriptional ArsR family regulator